MGFGFGFVLGLGVGVGLWLAKCTELSAIESVVS